MSKFSISILKSIFLVVSTLTSVAVSEERPATKLLITGGMTPIGLERLGKPITIITHEELLEKSEPSLGELLATQPGVSSSYFGPGASRPIIRGQAKERVRILENSLTTGDVSQLSDDHAVAVDPLSIQRVDVLRGPSTLLYGSSAIGGVVNMIDQSIAEENITEELTGELDLRKGDSADNELSGATSLNGSLANLNWHLSGFYRDTDNIEIPGFAESEQLMQQELLESQSADVSAEEPLTSSAVDSEEAAGTLENSDTLSKGFKVGASKVWGKSFWGLALRVIDSNYGIPGAHGHESSDDSEEENIRIDLEQVRVESRGSIDLDDQFFNTLKTGFAYSDYVHKELEGSFVGTRFDQRTFEARSELTHIHDDGFEGGIGSQINWEELDASGEEAFVPPSETFTPALFAVEDYKINQNFVWQLGGRIEHANIDPQNLSSRSFTLLSSSTGFIYSWPEQDSIALNLAYSERAPSASELFANGPHAATQSFEIGSADLDQERSVGTEIVYSKSAGKFSGSASLFWQRYFDYINLAPTAEEREGLQVFNYSAEQAEFIGFEIDSDYELFTNGAHQVALYGQVDYVRAKSLSSNQPLPRITPLRAKLGLKYSYADISAYIESLMVAEQDRVADFELPTSSYYLLNTGVAYEIANSGAHTYEVYLRGTNLTNQEARVHTSFLKDVAPLRGRAFLGGLRVRF